MSLATDTNYRNPFKSKRHNCQRWRLSYIVVICKNKSYITFVIDSPLMMAQSRAESTRDTYNYGKYINQFTTNTLKLMREFERIQKKICGHKMSIMFNEICIYIYIYICHYGRPILKPIYNYSCLFSLSSVKRMSRVATYKWLVPLNLKNLQKCFSKNVWRL